MLQEGHDKILGQMFGSGGVFPISSVCNGVRK